MKRSDFASNQAAENRASAWSIGRGSVFRLVMPLTFTAFLFIGPSVSRPAATAEEPARKFLESLRQAGYFDMAVIYLDRLDRYPSVDRELLDAADLERAQVFVDAALAATKAADQEESFRSAEEQLKKFVSEKPGHPRTSEARLQLGRLQMVRAAQLVAADPTDSQRKEAREVYLDAAKTFTAIADQLRETLRAMRGQKIDAQKEPEKVARRDQDRFAFLQAQLSIGEAKLLAAETYADPAADGKTLLDEAETQFADLVDKYGDYVQGALANVSLGKTRQAQGDFQSAKTSFMEMLEQPDADALREGKMMAMQGLLEITTVEKSGDYPAVIDRGRRWVDTFRPNEVGLPSAQDLRLALATAYLMKADDENINANIRKRATADARRQLLAAEKVGGPHQQRTKELLAEIGIERNEVADVDVDDPQSLDDALDVAREYLKQAEDLDASVKKMIAEKAPDDDIRKTQDELSTVRTRGIEVLRRGLSLVKKDSNLESVNNARQYLTYFLLLEGRYRETAAVGSFVARTAPGTPIGKSCGLWALTALQQLLVESGEQIEDGLAAQVSSLGSFLTTSWPDDPETAQAQGVMIRIALRKKRWDEAEQLIGELADGPEKAAMKRLTGQVLFGESLQARRDDNPDEERLHRKRAIELLQVGLDGIMGKLVAPEAVAASLTLAKAQLRDDRPDEAVATLRHPTYGPLTTIGKVDPPSLNFHSDVYATQLNALVAMLTGPSARGTKQQQLLADIDTAMKNLRQSTEGAGVQDRLVDTLFRLARDLRDQVDTAPPGKRDQYIGALEIFLQRIAATTADPTIVQWVAQESLTLGESLMIEGQRQADGRSLQLIQTASAALEKLKQADSASSPALRFQLGRAKRLSGDYPAALNELSSVLAETPQMLNAQVEAALTYEQWAPDLKPEHVGSAYKAAMLGGRPGDDGKNVIWGWGKISTAASRVSEYRDTFFEARYHVARCRFLMGKATGSDKVIDQAVQDVLSTYAAYPELGGAKQQAKFNALLKQIQAAAGKPTVGLPQK